MFARIKSSLGISEEVPVENGENDTENQFNDTERKGLFATLKSYIGKDVASLPIWVFEPTSFLHIMAEPLQFEDFLKKAATHEDPCVRLVYLAAFNVALYNLPFNPLLGETLEVIDENFKFLAEQVCHHPPISVAEIDSKNYSCNLATHMKTNLSGNSADVTILGINQFDGKTFGEHITWNHIKTIMHNIIIGSMWVDHFGDLTITNHTTNEKLECTFTKSGFLGNGRYEVHGKAFDAEGKPRYEVSGKWNTSFGYREINEDGSFGEFQNIWTKENTHLEVVPNKFKLTKYAHDKLINIDEEYEKTLPPTDSRLRADRRALQLDDPAAGKNKTMLEELQRTQRREREAQGVEWKPKYFEAFQDGINEEQCWRYIGNYWEERDERIERSNEEQNIPQVNKEDNEGNEEETIEDNEEENNEESIQDITETIVSEGAKNNEKSVNIPQSQINEETVNDTIVEEEEIEEISL